MPLGFDRSQWQRNRKLRRLLLRELYLAKEFNGGWVGGRTIVKAVLNDLTVSVGENIQDDSHAARLLQDLEDARLIERSNGRVSNTQPRTFDHAHYKITIQGTQLYEQEIPPVPGVEDDRIFEDE